MKIMSCIYYSPDSFWIIPIQCTFAALNCECGVRNSGRAEITFTSGTLNG